MGYVLTDKDWSPTVPEQGKRSKCSDGGNHVHPESQRAEHDHKANLRLSQDVNVAWQGCDQLSSRLAIVDFTFIVSYNFLLCLD